MELKMPRKQKEYLVACIGVSIFH